MIVGSVAMFPVFMGGVFYLCVPVLDWWCGCMADFLEQGLDCPVLGSGWIYVFFFILVNT